MTLKYKTGKLFAIITLTIILDPFFRNTLSNTLIFTFTISILDQIRINEFVTWTERILCESKRHDMGSKKPLHNRPKRVRVTFDEISELVITDNNCTMFNGILNGVSILVVRTGVDDAFLYQ